MKQDMVLTLEQQQTVLDHLYLVPYVIKTRIHTKESIYGLGFEELEQEGYVLLCRAAGSFDPSCGTFPSYAKKVIYNGLISHCRKVYQHESRFTPMKADENGDALPFPDKQAALDSFTMRAEMVEIVDLLSFYAQQYQGTTKRGIEALCWKLQGPSITDIASTLRVPPSHVGAWISKAKQALRRNPEFIRTIY